MKKNILLFFLMTTLLYENQYSQISTDDIASWGLNILGGQLNKNKNYDLGFAAKELSKVFKESSQRRYQKELAHLMYSTNIDNDYYFIENGTFYNIPNGYFKLNNQWYSFHDFPAVKLAIIDNGGLYEVPRNHLLFYGNNEWKKIDLNSIEEGQGLMYSNGTISILKDGVYRKNKEWHSIGELSPLDEEQTHSVVSDNRFDIYFDSHGTRQIYAYSLPPTPKWLKEGLDVTVKIDIGKEGTVGGVYPITEIDPKFQESILKALRLWRFSKYKGNLWSSKQYAIINFAFYDHLSPK